jgi:hypothetical protein
MDSSSRRAFALDSRTVWVEQQLVHDVLMARENLPLGPGEYTPSLRPFERHVCTPVIGKIRGASDQFRSPVSYRRMTSNSPPRAQSSQVWSRDSPSLKRIQSPTASYHLHHESSHVSVEERSEFKTIFHDNDHRDPLDPKLRHTITPGPYRGQDQILEKVDQDGKHIVHNTLQFGRNDIPFGERATYYKKALPAYDIKYDSRQLRPSTKMGSFAKNKRIFIPQKEQKIDDEVDGHLEDGYMEASLPIKPKYNRQMSPTNLRQERSGFIRSPSQSPTGSPKRSVFDAATEAQQVSGDFSLAEYRCSLVRLPKVKKSPYIVKLKFDDSSYRKKKKLAEPLLLTPTIIKTQAKIDIFGHLLAIPRPHKAPGLKIQAMSPGHHDDESDDD